MRWPVAGTETISQGKALPAAADCWSTRTRAGRSFSASKVLRYPGA